MKALLSTLRETWNQPLDPSLYADTRECIVLLAGALRDVGVLSTPSDVSAMVALIVNDMLPPVLGIDQTDPRALALYHYHVKMHPPLTSHMLDLEHTSPPGDDESFLSGGAMEVVAATDEEEEERGMFSGVVSSGKHVFNIVIGIVVVLVTLYVAWEVVWYVIHKAVQFVSPGVSVEDLTLQYLAVPAAQALMKFFEKLTMHPTIERITTDTSGTTLPQQFDRIMVSQHFVTEQVIPANSFLLKRIPFIRTDSGGFLKGFPALVWFTALHCIFPFIRNISLIGFNALAAEVIARSFDPDPSSDEYIRNVAVAHVGLSLIRHRYSLHVVPIAMTTVRLANRFVLRPVASIGSATTGLVGRVGGGIARGWRGATSLLLGKRGRVEEVESPDADAQLNKRQRTGDSESMSPTPPTLLDTTRETWLDPNVVEENRIRELMTSVQDRLNDGSIARMPGENRRAIIDVLSRLQGVEPPAPSE